DDIEHEIERRESVATKETPTALASAEDFLGAFMLVQFFSKYQFQFGEDDFAGLMHKVPPHLHSVARSWTIVYLAWLLRQAAIARHGKAFDEKMMAAVYKRLGEAQSKEPICKEIAQTLRVSFGNLDEAAADAINHPLVVGGQRVPRVFHCALAFLALETASPYYGKGAPDIGIAEVIALLLADAEDARRKFI